MMRSLWRWVWADLGYEAPHPGRCLVWVGAAVVLSLGLWAALVLCLLALA
jgi:hypothetical protein